MILYYWGEFHAPGNPDGKPPTALEQTDFSKVRQLLMEKNKGTIEELNNAARVSTQEARRNPVQAKVTAIKKETTNLKAIIKTDKDAKYRNTIDMVDEMEISGIGSYGVMDSLKVDEQKLVDAIKPTL